MSSGLNLVLRLNDSSDGWKQLLKKLNMDNKDNGLSFLCVFANEITCTIYSVNDLAFLKLFAVLGIEILVYMST